MFVKPLKLSASRRWNLPPRSASDCGAVSPRSGATAWNTSSPRSPEGSPPSPAGRSPSSSRSARCVVWAVTGPIFGYSETWQLVINTGTTIVTFLMVFLVQNSQNRDAAAFQAKLDELIRAVEQARNQFIGIEHMTDKEIERDPRRARGRMRGDRRPPAARGRRPADDPALRRLVGATGFEPATCGTQNRRATRLRHAPTAQPLAQRAPPRKRNLQGWCWLVHAMCIGCTWPVHPAFSRRSSRRRPRPRRRGSRRRRRCRASWPARR